MEDEYIVMTARQIRKKYPRNKDVFAINKALQDADIEPFMDEDSPEMPDLPPRQESIFTRFFNWLLGRQKYNRVARC